MPNKTTSHTGFQSPGSFSQFDDRQLRETMRNFLEEEQKEQPSVWNFATIAGIAMFLVSMLFIFQLIGLIGSNLGGLVNALPFIGAILIGFIGFGFFVGDRKRVKKTLKKQRKRRRDYFENEFPSGNFDTDDEIDLEEELFGDAPKSHTKTGSSGKKYDKYAFRQSKKLYKSRTDKKLAGVCGGLAKYFGISATVIRVLFLIFMFGGAGSAFIAYIILAIALDKEPVIPSGNFDF